jgi:hypothetical protein
VVGAPFFKVVARDGSPLDDPISTAAVIGRRCFMDPTLGQIQLFAFGYAPTGWALCSGQTLNITTNQALFSLISNVYGGDGRTTFALPNLNGAAGQPSASLRTDSYMQYYIATEGLYPQRP